MTFRLLVLEELPILFQVLTIVLDSSRCLLGGRGLFSGYKRAPLSTDLELDAQSHGFTLNYLAETTIEAFL